MKVKVTIICTFFLNKKMTCTQLKNISYFVISHYCVTYFTDIHCFPTVFTEKTLVRASKYVLTYLNLPKYDFTLLLFTVFAEVGSTYSKNRFFLSRLPKRSYKVGNKVHNESRLSYMTPALDCRITIRKCICFYSIHVTYYVYVLYAIHNHNYYIWT